MRGKQLVLTSAMKNQNSCHGMFRRPFAAFRVCVILLVWMNAAAVGQGADRLEWRYDTANGMRRIVVADGGEWQQLFPNGTTGTLIEQSRTEEYIELLNPDNRNVLRLYDDHGTVQKSQAGPFRRFTDGKWSAVTSPPMSNTKNECDFKIRIVYFVPNDRRPTQDYEGKIRAVMSLAAEIMTNDLRSKGYVTDGPPFEMQDGQMVVHLLRGELSAKEYNQNGQWKSSQHGKMIFDEVGRRSFPANEFMTLVFAETYEESASPRLWPGHIALASANPPNGGIGVFSAWILRDEFATSDPLLLRRRFFDDSQHSSRHSLDRRQGGNARSDFLEDGVGGALHELSHLFGLTHHGGSESTHIMAQGFRNLRWNVGIHSNPTLQARYSDENAAMLMASRYLNVEVDRSDARKPEVKLILESSGGQVKAKVRATDDKNLNLVALVVVTESRGRQLIAMSKVNGVTHELQSDIPRSVFGDTIEAVQVIAVDSGGNHGKVTRTLPN